METWRACGCTPNHTLSLQPAIEEPDMSTQVDDLSEWRSFFDEAADFVEGIERQYGVANERFTEYAHRYYRLPNLDWKRPRYV